MIVSEQIISVLNYVCEKLGLVINWTEDNMLPYVTELMAKFIRYEIATSVVSCVLIATLTIFFFVMVKKSFPKAKEDYFEIDCLSSWIAIGSIIGLVVTLIVTMVTFHEEIFDIIECITFPEKFIADYAMTLMKN